MRGQDKQYPESQQSANYRLGQIVSLKLRVNIQPWLNNSYVTLLPSAPIK